MISAYLCAWVHVLACISGMLFSSELKLILQLSWKLTYNSTRRKWKRFELLYNKGVWYFNDLRFTWSVILLITQLIGKITVLIFYNHCMLLLANKWVSYPSSCLSDFNYIIYIVLNILHSSYHWQLTRGPSGFTWTALLMEF